MLGLHIADVAVLVVYLVGIMAIGIWSARMIKNMGDYFMPRTFGKAFLVMHAFGSGGQCRFQDLYQRSVGHMVSVAVVVLHSVLLADRADYAPL